MTIWIASFLFIFLAEMGDKTQLLAIVFASKYRWQTVLWGVFAATLCNHFLAVLVGGHLTVIAPVRYIKLAAAASFILFGLWALRVDKPGNQDKRFQYTPFWTVAFGMFLAEMGDKTQLGTVALAAHYESIVPVWLGTTAGMVVADAVGIVVGVVMGKSIPARFLRWFAAFVFIVFGVLGLYDAAPAYIWTWPVICGGAALLILSICAILWVDRTGEP